MLFNILEKGHGWLRAATKKSYERVFVSEVHSRPGGVSGYPQAWCRSVS